MIDAEGRAPADNAADDIVAKVAELGGIGRLGIGHQHGLEASVLARAAESKVDRRR